MIILFLTCFCLSVCQANNDSILPKRDLSVSIYSLAYQSIKITPIGNDNLLKSGISPTAKIEFAYRQRLYQTYYFDAALGLSIVPVFFKYEIQLNPDHPLYTYNNIKTVEDKSYYLENMVLNAGFHVSKQTKIRNNVFLNNVIGIDLNFFPTFFVGYSNYYDLHGQVKDSSYKIFELNLNDPIEQGQAIAYGLLSYSAKIGITKYNRKQNSWEINLMCNYQPNIIGKGTYEFIMGNEKKRGVVKWRNNYIGLQFIKRWATN